MIDADELRGIVAQHLPRRDPDAPRSVLGAGSDDIESGRAWLAFAADHAIVTAGWPEEYGGRGADEDDQAVIASVLREFDVPDLYPYAVGLSLVAPPGLFVRVTDRVVEVFLLSVPNFMKELEGLVELTPLQARQAKLLPRL